jgi:hypothetical protein
MIYSHRLRIAGIVAALSVAFGLAGCGGSPPPRIDPVLASINLDSNGAVTAGATIQGTATLDKAAISGGAGITLSSSNPSIATVQGTVFIPEGATSERFTVTGVSAGTATITGTFGGPRTATVNVASAPIDLLSITLSTNTVSGITTVPGTVRISGPAPSGGTAVGLSSSNTSAATVPSSVTVSQGDTTQSFNVDVKTAGSANVTITGTVGNSSGVTNLAINAVAISPAFKVIPDAGSAATGEQCEVVRVTLSNGSSVNSPRCTFDAGASTPQGAITTYTWRFFVPGGSQAFTRTTPTLSGIQLPCGSFGSSGATFTRDVTLEIETPNGKNGISRSITFIRNGPCG